jgi:hypothetical protein
VLRANFLWTVFELFPALLLLGRDQGPPFC